MMLHFEPGGKDFAKNFILEWLGQTGGSNINLISAATGLPVNILIVLLEELMFESNITYEKCYRGLKIWRVGGEIMNRACWCAETLGGSKFYLMRALNVSVKADVSASKLPATLSGS